MGCAARPPTRPYRKNKWQAAQHGSWLVRMLGGLAGREDFICAGRPWSFPCVMLYALINYMKMVFATQKIYMKIAFEARTSRSYNFCKITKFIFLSFKRIGFFSVNINLFYTSRNFHNTLTWDPCKIINMYISNSPTPYNSRFTIFLIFFQIVLKMYTYIVYIYNCHFSRIFWKFSRLLEFLVLSSGTCSSSNKGKPKKAWMGIRR